jgi:hypothetical protein
MIQKKIGLLPLPYEEGSMHIQNKNEKIHGFEASASNFKGRFLTQRECYFFINNSAVSQGLWNHFQPIILYSLFSQAYRRRLYIKTALPESWVACVTSIGSYYICIDSSHFLGIHKLWDLDVRVPATGRSAPKKQQLKKLRHFLFQLRIFKSIFFESPKKCRNFEILTNLVLCQIFEITLF